MQDMKTATFDGKEITVRELTVKQVREVFSILEKEDASFLDDLLDQPVPALIIAKATGIPIDELYEHRPSALAELAKEVAAVNPSVASLIKKRLALYEKMQDMGFKQLLTEQPAG